MPLIYLAGPMVFMPDHGDCFANLKDICRQHGLTGVSPFDPPGWCDGLSGRALAQAIKRANMDKIAQAKGVIACISPFRGPGADGGTAWEMGYAQALGIATVAWTQTSGDYVARAAAPGTCLDAAGWQVEDFGLADNLMLTADIEVFDTFAQAARHMAGRLGV